ncbi:MAG: DNA methyltransferase, partial [Betaproteobacteria bacterium]
MEQLTFVETKDALRQPTSGVVPFSPVSKGFKLQYEHQNVRLYQGNSFDWLESLDDASVDLVFADPPYNIKKAEWDNFDSQEKYIEWSIKWIKQTSRVLKPTGSLYV